jgi:flavin-dependent dehydrogenase
VKYDLIVVGGGPGGLMAAKTAAEDGLRVVLIERKRNITEINRHCGQSFYIRKMSSSKAGLHGDGYIDPVSVELGSDKTTFHFPVPGFSLDYTGPLKPYYNRVDCSPSKYMFYRSKNTIWAFFYQKEAFLAGLLASAQKAGAEIMPETIGMGAENTPDGVRVQVRGKSGEQTLEARAAIAADGLSSNIVESLGLNKKRQVLTSRQGRGLICYDMEGVEADIPPFSWLNCCIPSINRKWSFFLAQLEGDLTMLIGGSEEGLQQFMKLPNFAPWFRHARVVRKTASATGGRHGILTPIEEPVEGNVVVVGDAGAPTETWIQGAVACGYQAVKAILKELDGQKGYQEYINWWQKAFYFNKKTDYFRMVCGMFALSNAWSCDEDVDDVYKLLQNKENCLILQHLDVIKAERPDIYERIKKGYEEAETMLSKLGS